MASQVAGTFMGLLAKAFYEGLDYGEGNGKDFATFLDQNEQAIQDVLVVIDTEKPHDDQPEDTVHR